MKRFIAAAALVTTALVGGTAAFADGPDHNEITIQECPSAVMDAIDQHAAGMVVEEIELGYMNGQTIYQVEATDGIRETELAIREDGSLLWSHDELEDDDD